MSKRFAGSVAACASSCSTNLREGVLTPDIYEPTLNTLYRDPLAHYGAVALSCRVNDPDRKGKVEAGVGHAKRTPLKGQRFELGVCDNILPLKEFITMKQYRPGDTITIEVNLEDESGIETVAMVFRMDNNIYIELRYPGPVTFEPVSLTHKVTEESAPGVYRLSAFVATDSRQNRSDFTPNPDWDFEILNHPVDTQGPKLNSVTFK